MKNQQSETRNLCARCGDELFTSETIYICPICGAIFCEFDGEFQKEEYDGYDYDCPECCEGETFETELKG